MITLMLGAGGGLIVGFGAGVAWMQRFQMRAAGVAAIDEFLDQLAKQPNTRRLSVAELRRQRSAQTARDDDSHPPAHHG